MIYLVHYYDYTLKREVELPIDLDVVQSKSTCELRVHIPEQNYRIDEYATYIAPQIVDD